jgi:hypothetical protein
VFDDWGEAFDDCEAGLEVVPVELCDCEPLAELLLEVVPVELWDCEPLTELPL